VGPVLGTVAAVAAWFGVAHSSGSGWVQALGAMLAGCIVVGLLGPALFVRRARCSVAESPADTVAGATVELTVSTSAPVVVRSVDPPGPARATGDARTCTLEVVPPHRGERRVCTLELASAAPFGLLWWTKRVTVALPRPLCVAPPLGAARAVEHDRDDDTGDDARLVHRRVGEPRGVRDYRPGDLRSWVHWRATAHAGTLMVREMEGPAARPVTVWGILPDDPDLADEEASRALGEVAAQLAAGRSVVLVTTEPEGPVQRQVCSVADAGRRLARALPQRDERVGGR
jgi:uncharacterized protein (DUF58 family)